MMGTSLWSTVVRRPAFPAKASPTEYTHALGGTGWTANCRTGFSREEASEGALDFALWLLTFSRLKPVLPVMRVLIPMNFSRTP